MAEAAGRRTFGPVVLLGLASAGFAAVAGHKPMLHAPVDLKTVGGAALNPEWNRVEFPLAGALALVALACWGVLLVTRGVVRRVVAAVATLAAAGVLAVLVLGGFAQKDDAAADLGTRIGLGGATVPIQHTAWFWIALGTAGVALAAGSAALCFVRDWPEMGSRYDAPTTASAAAPATSAPAEDPAGQSNLDLWKSLDEGDDPTV